MHKIFQGTSGRKEFNKDLWIRGAAESTRRGLTYVCDLPSDRGPIILYMNNEKSSTKSFIRRIPRLLNYRVVHLLQFSVLTFLHEIRLCIIDS